MTRKEIAENTKRKIFDAAMRLLENKSLESITVRDIIREADVSIGTFYNYYQTKLEVYYETYVLADEYFETSVYPKLNQDSRIERIIQFFYEYGYYQSNIGSFSLTKILYNSDNKCFHRKSEIGMLPILEELCKEAKENGEFKTEKTPSEISEFLMICIRGFCYDWCISNGSYSLKDRLKEESTLLLKVFQ